MSWETRVIIFPDLHRGAGMLYTTPDLHRISPDHLHELSYTRHKFSGRINFPDPEMLGGTGGNRWIGIGIVWSHSQQDSFSFLNIKLLTVKSVLVVPVHLPPTCNEKIPPTTNTMIHNENALNFSFSFYQNFVQKCVMSLRKISPVFLFLQATEDKATGAPRLSSYQDHHPSIHRRTRTSRQEDTSAT